MRMRTIEGAAQHFRELDANSAITAYAIRQAVKNGSIPYARAGAKYLVSIENLEIHFAGKTMPTATLEQYGKIRAVEL